MFSFYAQKYTVRWTFELLSCVDEGSIPLRFYELPNAKYLSMFRQQLMSASSVSRFLRVFDPEDSYLTLL